MPNGQTDPESYPEFLIFLLNHVKRPQPAFIWWCVIIGKSILKYNTLCDLTIIILWTICKELSQLTKAAALAQKVWYWPVMGDRRVSRGFSFFLWWLQDKCDHHWRAQEHRQDNECKRHGARAGWSIYRSAAFRVAQTLRLVGGGQEWPDRDAALGIVCQGLGTWVFIFLYPRVSLKYLTLFPVVCEKVQVGWSRRERKRDLKSQDKQTRNAEEGPKKNCI